MIKGDSEEPTTKAHGDDEVQANLNRRRRNKMCEQKMVSE
jgi:hypothetical protein